MSICNVHNNRVPEAFSFTMNWEPILNVIIERYLKLKGHVDQYTKEANGLHLYSLLDLNCSNAKIHNEKVLRHDATTILSWFSMPILVLHGHQRMEIEIGEIRKSSTQSNGPKWCRLQWVYNRSSATTHSWPAWHNQQKIRLLSYEHSRALSAPASPVLHTSSTFSLISPSVTNNPTTRAPIDLRSWCPPMHYHNQVIVNALSFFSALLMNNVDATKISFRL